MKKHWTEEQIAWLKNNYSEKGIKECAVVLCRSVHEIKRMAGKHKLYLSSRWTEQKLEFLRKHYAERGTEFCANQLNTTRNSISHYAKKLGLFLIPETKTRLLRKVQPKNYSDYTVNPDNFINNISAESAYVLGLLWADGHIYKKINNKNNYRINLVCCAEDIHNIKETILKTGDWSFKAKPQISTKQELCTIVFTNNRHLHKFLSENDYTIKSESSANKILSIIPSTLHRYFFLGLIDGDGCWFYKKYKYDSRKFFISSSYNQDWSYVEQLFKSLNIKYTIRRNILTSGRNSEICFTKRVYFKYLYDYLWPNGFEFGFLRKYQKANLTL